MIFCISDVELSYERCIRANPPLYCSVYPTYETNMAIEVRKPKAGLLHHSDRGSQYDALEYQDILDRHGVNCSMSRKGNCWDNAPMECFFDTIKTELLYQQRFQTREQARGAIFEYIECFGSNVMNHPTY